MTPVAQRRQFLQGILTLLAEVPVGAMMHLQAVARITRATAVAIPCERSCSEPPPRCGTEIGLIIHCLACPGRATPHPLCLAYVRPRQAINRNGPGFWR